AIAAAGWKYWHHAHRETTCEVPIKFQIRPLLAFGVGLTFTATDLPTNVPLIAVAEALVANDASPLTTILSCLAYSLVRIAPPAALLLIYLVKKEKSVAIIDRIQAPLVKCGQHLLFRHGLRSASGLNPAIRHSRILHFTVSNQV
ncbi:MAG: hypothetical protein K2Z81_10960, partial [Cyanobacteria bacterium]|nr:hypothetical protein [Cyanobacteriota bacterium]